jgi:hypothetical protein
MTMAYTRWRSDYYITTWLQFNRIVRKKNRGLLIRLDQFPNSILVAGCQRSGTTMIARIITQSDGMTNYWFGPDDELDAALILSGYVDHQPQGRYCFQTTYVNNWCQEDYLQLRNHKVLWVLRNPYSVVYSMLYNWNYVALFGLFEMIGVSQLTGLDAWLYKLLGLKGVSNLHQACHIFNGKVSQLFRLRQNLCPDNLMVVDYDDLIIRKEIVLPAIYKFIGLEYREEYLQKIHSKGLFKAKGLSRKERSTIKNICEPLYLRSKDLITTFQEE